MNFEKIEYFQNDLRPIDRGYQNKLIMSEVKTKKIGYGRQTPLNMS